MIGIAFVAALTALPIQAPSPTWLKCDWNATRTTVTVIGKASKQTDTAIQQSRTYQFDPTTKSLSVYDPAAQALLHHAFGVSVNDDVVLDETAINSPPADGQFSRKIYLSIQINRRTLEITEFDTLDSAMGNFTDHSTTIGMGRCVKIDPMPIAPKPPAQF